MTFQKILKVDVKNVFLNRFLAHEANNDESSEFVFC